MLLADLGADVTRVERAGATTTHADKYVMNRGRRSLAVDLKHPDGLAVVRRLVDEADALIEGYRPGVMERLGFGPDECLERNPGLVYGRMTGWGQDGPLAPTAGHDIDYIALSGALSCVARHGERPVAPVNFVGDMGGGGLFLALGIVAALWERSASGQGQVVDTAMVDGSAVITTMLHGMLAQGRWTDEAGVNFSDSGSHYYDTYTCADGRHIAVGAIEGQFYAELLDGLGLADVGLPDQGDRSHWPAMKARFQETFATKTLDEWMAVFDGTDACVAPVLRLTEAPSHPHNRARRVFVEHDGITQPAPAPRFSRTPSALERPPVVLGADTIEVLADLGYDHAAIARMIADGVVSPPPTD